MNTKMIVVSGASGGIGLAVVKGCLLNYPGCKIHATYHTHQPDFDHKQVQWHKVQLDDEYSVKQLAEQIPSVDLLVNAAGFLHSAEHPPEKTIRAFNPDFFSRNINSNTLPAILLAKYFEPALRKAEKPIFITLSARVGSISDNQMGGWLSYRASKAALNMAMKTVQIEWKYKMPKCCLLIYHPGTVDTALSSPFKSHLPQSQLQSPEEAAANLIQLIDNATPERSGQFVDWEGDTVEW